MSSYGEDLKRIQHYLRLLRLSLSHRIDEVHQVEGMARDLEDKLQKELGGKKGDSNE